MTKLPGKKQMILDLELLNKTIVNENILFTLRFYQWDGNWLSIGHHQRNLPIHWEELSKEGILNIVRRPSGGGAVLHSGGITYSLTYKKPSHKKFSYEIINNWLIESFSKMGLTLQNGKIRKSLIKYGACGTS